MPRSRGRKRAVQTKPQDDVTLNQQVPSLEKTKGGKKNS